MGTKVIPYVMIMKRILEVSVFSVTVSAIAVCNVICINN